VSSAAPPDDRLEEDAAEIIVTPQTAAAIG